MKYPWGPILMSFHSHTFSYSLCIRLERYNLNSIKSVSFNHGPKTYLIITNSSTMINGTYVRLNAFSHILGDSDVIKGTIGKQD